MSDTREWAARRSALVGYREGDWIGINDWLAGDMPDPIWHGEKTGRAMPRSKWMHGHSNAIHETDYDELLALMDAEGLTWDQAISGTHGREIIKRVGFSSNSFMVGTAGEIEPGKS